MALADRSYDVSVGFCILDRLADFVPRLAKAHVAIVTDSTVATLHLAHLEAELRGRDRYRGTVVVPAGERSKCFAELERVCRDLLRFGVERGDVVIALGGGVVGDLAGFAAAVLRRGVAFVQVPTTLLACVDSSVGGKTGLNVAEGKNLIGAFHQPIGVVADLSLLDTLPERDMRAGYAEIAKCGLLGDDRFFAWLEENGSHTLGRRPDALAEAVCRSIRIKADIVAEDEHETGRRALLNLGHTFGHALEAYAGYSDRLLHGEAVAIGLHLAARLSEELGSCPQGTAARVSRHLHKVGLPTSVGDLGWPPLPIDAVLSLMLQDKKVRAGQLTFVLLKGVGQAVVRHDVPHHTVHEFLSRTLI